MSIPREGSRDTDKGILVSCAPDWCWVQVGSSRVLVPFNIYAKQADDANTAPTVRQQGKRSHTSGSLILECHGDEAGNGLGVKSGTKESVCQPKTWSKTVRIEGKHAVRHNDEWWMNNRNTIGKLAYMEDVTTYEKPKGGDGPNYASLLNDNNNIIKSQNAFGQSWQVASNAATIPMPSSPTLTIPDAMPAMRLLSVLGMGVMGHEAGQIAGQWYIGQEGIAAKRIGEVVGGQVSAFSPQGYEIGSYLGFPSLGASGQIAYANGLLSLKAGEPVDFRTADPTRLRELIAQPWPDAATLKKNAARLRDAATANVRVTGREKKQEEDCRVGRYGSLKCPGQQAHHIVPDSVVRYGTRDEGKRGVNRIDNMPSLRDGPAICVTGHARVDDTEHFIAHEGDSFLLAAGASGNPVGTTTLAKAKEIGIESAIKAKPECAAQIVAAMEIGFAGIDPNQLVNATMQPAAGDAREALSRALKAGEWPLQ